MKAFIGHDANESRWHYRSFQFLPVQLQIILEIASSFFLSVLLILMIMLRKLWVNNSNSQLGTHSKTKTIHTGKKLNLLISTKLQIMQSRLNHWSCDANRAFWLVLQKFVMVSLIWGQFFCSKVTSPSLNKQLFDSCCCCCFFAKRGTYVISLGMFFISEFFVPPACIVNRYLRTSP